MNKLTTGICAVLFAATTVVGAMNFGNGGCGQSMCCGSFEVGAEALYMRPSACDLNYVISDPRAFVAFGNQNATADALPQGKQKAIDPSYDWGFRVSAGYVFDNNCSDVSLEYTYFHPRSSDNALPEGAGGLWMSIGHPRYTSKSLFSGVANAALTEAQKDALANARVRYNLDAVDLQFGSRSMKGCDMWVRSFVGLHYANIEQRLDVAAQGTINPGQASGSGPDDAINFTTALRNSRCVWGIGPKFGVDARYYISCGFGIGARFAVGLIAGETNGRAYQKVTQATVTQGSLVINPVAIDQTLDVSYGNRSIVIPMINARLGVNYTFCCGDCFVLMGEVGYEFISYINALGDSVFNDIGATQSQSCYSFNVDGLYIMGRITF